MSLSNAVVKTGPSAITPTGGTDLTFAISAQGANRVELYVPADTDLRLRRTLSLLVVPPRPAAGSVNGYSNARAMSTFRKPKLLANGKIAIATIKTEISYDVEYTQAEIQELMDVDSQITSDADFTSLWKALALQ